MSEKTTPLFNFEKVDEALKNCTQWSDLLKDGGPFQLMFKDTLETLMKKELESHLGYVQGDYAKARQVSNKRNGTSSKTLKTSAGEIVVNIPRDREGTFESKILPTHSSLDPKLEDQIISMYSKGMSTRDISEHLKSAFLGVEISPSMISQVTDNVLEKVDEWHNRPLDKLYPIVYLDAFFLKVRDDNKLKTKAFYTVKAISIEGKKEILGIFCCENESSTFWLTVITELQSRGVQDILIACVDGLKGFPEAINAVFPKTEVQKCVVHQIRNTMKYITTGDQKNFFKDLRKVYTAPNKEKAELELDGLETIWGDKYPYAINTWRNNWENLSLYFQYGSEIRRAIYTTNPVESFHRQVRKLTKTKSSFPSEKSAKKLLYLAVIGVSAKWNKPVKNWPLILSQLSIHFADRLKNC